MYIVTYIVESPVSGLITTHTIAVLAKSRAPAIVEAIGKMSSMHRGGLTGIKSAEWMNDATR